MSDPVLVVNAGSSSLKYALVDPGTGRRRLAGLVERIGEPGSPVADHRSAFGEVRRALADAGVIPRLIGHRVVHGGAFFSAPAVIDDRVVAAIADCVPLAPLHNPAALVGIEAARTEFPTSVGVAVFDTAFHMTMPPAARTYAIDRELARSHGVRRYGFHGTSHRFVAHRTASMLGRDVGELNQITLHLGNGASACAIRGGDSIDTSMGVTPLEGLVMGTRSGDIDPAVPLILWRAGLTATEVDGALNRQGGLRGLAGVNDMREVHAMAEAGDTDADLARQVYVHRIRHYVGAYLATLGTVDALVFTAGVGEHDSWVREQVCAGWRPLGIELDAVANRSGSGDRIISTATSATAVLVVATDEEWEIARQADDAVSSAPAG